MLILTRGDLKRLLPMSAVLAAVREAYESVADGTAVVPQRHSIHIPEKHGDTLVMSGFLSRLPALGLKVVSVFPENPRLGLPSTTGAVVMVNAETGAPSALMDGGFLTAIRTGAGSGVATGALARPDASTLAILGCGGMAWHQVEAVCNVRPIEQVYLWNRTPERAHSFAAELRDRLPGRKVSVVASSEEAVRAAAVICAATSSAEPVICGAWLQPGTHVNLVGSHHPDVREADTEAMCGAAVIAVDSVSAALHAGDLAIPIKEGRLTAAGLVEVGAILAGGAPGRRTPEDVTIFKSVGIAAQDLAVGSWALRRAQELGLGMRIDILAED